MTAQFVQVSFIPNHLDLKADKLCAGSYAAECYWGPFGTSHVLCSAIDFISVATTYQARCLHLLNVLTTDAQLYNTHHPSAACTCVQHTNSNNKHAAPLSTGYAKRGLRSAITSAAKEGITVEEVMHAPITADAITAAALSSSRSSVGAYTTAAAAAAGQWDGLAAEMQGVDAEWLSRKGQHAGEKKQLGFR